MKLYPTLFQPIFIACFLVTSSLSAASCNTGDCGPKTCGKVDLGAAYVHIDLLENGVTSERMDIPAGRLDICYGIWGGVAIKGNVTYGYNNQELLMTGVGLAHITPITDRITLTPVAGFNYSYLDTEADILLPLPFGYLTDISRTFRSYAGFIGLEGTYKICDGLRLYVSYQYAWTRNITDFNLPDPLPSRFREHSEGSAVSVQLEKDLNDKWSVNVAGAYNNSMSKERNGMRAYGFKAGIARWF